MLFLLLFSAVLIFFIIQKPFAVIDNHRFVIDIVRSQKDQEIGLAKYTAIPQNAGMYFPFAHPDYYSFWMKDMHFPIDIIYIRNNKIVSIIANAPVPQKNQPSYSLSIYRPTGPADAVLEINAHLSEQYGIKPGDTVTISM